MMSRLDVETGCKASMMGNLDLHDQADRIALNMRWHWNAILIGKADVAWQVN